MIAVIALATVLHAGQAGAGGYGPAYGPPGMGPGMAPGMGYGPMGYGAPMPYPAYPAYPAPAYGPPAHGPQGQGMPTYGAARAPAYDASRYPAPGGNQAASRQSGGYASPAASSPEAGSSRVAASGDGDSTVAVSGMRFNPPTITVKQGETVTWDFKDAVPHTVTSRGGEFASSRLSAGASYGHTFDQPGEYDYYCALHPAMVGKVVVEE